VAVHGHLPGWISRDDVEIVAATDARSSRRAECEARLPGVPWYDSAETLLAGAEPDFVDICTPPSSHAVLIRQALANGRHVLCEKPLVGSLAELREILELAAEAGRVLHTVHNWHHAPIVQQACQLVGAGAIGRVTHATWQTLRTQPAATAEAADNWRVDPRIAGGGVLTDHGWHATYLLHRWIGAAPTALAARLETRRHTRWPVEDTATLRLRFPHATADVFLTWAADERRNRVRLAGTDGSLELDDDALVLTSGGAQRRWSFASGLSDGSHHPEWFHAVADRFLAEVTAGAAEGTNLAEASVCVAVDTAARESSRRGGDERPLSIPAVTGLARPEPSR
jgi:predicted dehydrogenase